MCPEFYRQPDSDEPWQHLTAVLGYMFARCVCFDTTSPKGPLCSDFVTLRMRSVGRAAQRPSVQNAYEAHVCRCSIGGARRRAGSGALGPEPPFNK